MPYGGRCCGLRPTVLPSSYQSCLSFSSFLALSCKYMNYSVFLSSSFRYLLSFSLPSSPPSLSHPPSLFPHLLPSPLLFSLSLTFSLPLSPPPFPPSLVSFFPIPVFPLCFIPLSLLPASLPRCIWEPRMQRLFPLARRYLVDKRPGISLRCRGPGGSSP